MKIEMRSMNILLCRRNYTLLCRAAYLHFCEKNGKYEGGICSFGQAACIHNNCVLQKKRKTKEVQLLEKDKIFDITSVRKKKPVVNVWPNMTVAELAHAIGCDTDYLFELMTFVDNSIYYTRPKDVIHDWTVLCNLVVKNNMRPHRIGKPQPLEDIKGDKDVYRAPPERDEKKLVRRAPVVTIMGHVDHGKTTLLDSLRNSNIVQSEFGGITQHIGAFSVQLRSEMITFLDTPGHAAFSAMRSRGANCTDIVVLVVAADDGVMEQTIESIRMAQEAKVPMIVAINKIDKPTADINRTEKMLAARGIVVESMGGDVQAVPISALKGTNLDDLLDAILAQADLANLRSDPGGCVEGVVIESKLHPYKGKVSTALVQRGTMKKGDILTAGVAYARVRVMYDDLGREITSAPPSTPVEVSGWKELPLPGDIIIQVDSENRATEVVHCRQKKNAEEKAKTDLPKILEKHKEHLKEYEPILAKRRKLGFYRVRTRTGPRPKEINWEDSKTKLNVVIKCDVEGSLEAILNVLETYHCSNMCELNIITADIGKVSPGDVELAKDFEAVLYHFNVDCLPEASSLAKELDIVIRPVNVIYTMIDDIKNEINTRIPPRQLEEVLGEANVLQLFLIAENKKKNIPVAGCRCVKGELKKSGKYKVIRNGQVVHRGTLASMRNLKMEVNSIKKEQECGLRFLDTTFLFERGDIIQMYQPYTEPEFIQWDPFRAIATI